LMHSPPPATPQILGNYAYQSIERPRLIEVVVLIEINNKVEYSNFTFQP